MSPENGKGRQTVLSKAVNRRIGRAMHTYEMLQDGDRVLIAISGGVDSLVLAWVLKFWQKKAPINYELHGVHIDMGHLEGTFGPAALAVKEQVERLGISLEIVPAAWQPPVSPEDSENEHQENSSKGICFFCSRSRRNQIFKLAKQKKFTKVALGHHRGDINETFFLNLCFAGNISTMVPRQDLFDKRLALIRPLAYLDKPEIETIATNIGVVPVRSLCPLSEKTRRTEMRDLLEEIYLKIPGSRASIFSALANVRTEYLLKPDKGMGSNLYP